MEIRILRILLLLFISPVASLASGESVTLASFDFEDGDQEWTLEDNGRYSWQVSEGTLFMPAPQGREFYANTYATSPEITIEGEAELSFDVAFNSDMDAFCRLHLQVSDNDFVSYSTIWNSKDLIISPWGWKNCRIPLDSFKGKNVKFRFFYTMGAGYDRGGYWGEFAVDNFIITAEKTEVDPGENPGKDPDNPDKPVDPDIPDTPAKGPVAHIGLPVTFRDVDSGNPVMPPLLPVNFTDASEGDPTLSTWTFHGVEGEPLVIREKNPTVTFTREGDFEVTLVVQNEDGVSMAKETITVAYESAVANRKAEEELKIIELGADGEVFPGSSSHRISAYAEHFSAPATPVLLKGVNVYFSRVQIADALVGMSSIPVSICTADGVIPGETLATSYLLAADLPSVAPKEEAVPVYFEFESPVALSGEFFIVTEGIPAPSAGNCLGLAMVAHDSENTALLKVNGEWILPSQLEIPGVKDISLMFSPCLAHSVFKPSEEIQEVYEVNEYAGSIKIPVFSYLPLEATTDATWISFTYSGNEEGKMVTARYQVLPVEIPSRSASVSVTDGVSSFSFRVFQTVSASVEDIYTDEEIIVFTISGVEIFKGKAQNCPSLPGGVYIVSRSGKTAKLIIGSVL